MHVPTRGLSGNALKIIAAITMLIDHVGIILLPESQILRTIGRISFPIYAYMIAEGCYYTRNKLRYFLGIFALGAVCQAVYIIQSGDDYFGILITFSISIGIIYAMQYMKECFLFGAKAPKKLLSSSVFIASVLLTYFLNEELFIDYGFFGCMAPVFAIAPRMPRKKASAKPTATEEAPLFKQAFLRERLPSIASLTICLVFLALAMKEGQIFALLSIPLLLLYSGRRGKIKMKYFFYLFYPLHLVFLYGISEIFF